jgi:hypothetical protein
MLVSLTTVRHVGGQAVGGGEDGDAQAVQRHQRVLAPGGGGQRWVCSVGGGGGWGGNRKPQKALPKTKMS